jgi:hypothetical protein
MHNRSLVLYLGKTCSSSGETYDKSYMGGKELLLQELDGETNIGRIMKDINSRERFHNKAQSSMHLEERTSMGRNTETKLM